MQPASHKPVFDAAALPWAALSAAAACSDAAAFETLWQDHKRPEQARAAAVRTLFTGACARGDVMLAQWVQQQYPQHIDAKTLKDAGRKAIADAQMPVWDYLTGLLDTLPAGPSVYAELFRPALESAPLQVIQKIYPHVTVALSDFMYVPVLGGNMPALVWVTDTCREKGILGQEALDKALRLSVERAKMPMVSWLLGAGADAGAFADAMVNPAAQQAAQDGGEMLELLVRAGLHPRKAMAAVADNALLAARIADAAAETAAHHLAVLHRHCGQPPDAQKLRGHGAVVSGMTALHYAAEHRILAMMDRAIPAAADFAQKNARGETVIDVLARRDDVAAFFAPAAWKGQTEKLAAVLALLPAGAMAAERCEDIQRKAEQATLDDIIPLGGFKLKRRPSP